MDARARALAEERFVEVFGYLGLVRAYAARRGVMDPDAVAADVMTIAWRRLADIPTDDPRPWLIATARNIVFAQRRRIGPATVTTDVLVDRSAPDSESTVTLSPALEAALRALSNRDLECLLLIAWEDLSPRQAAASLGITAAAFRVRLHRARRRLAEHLKHPAVDPECCDSTPSLEGA